nr:ankyrin repeat-containing protein bda1 [Quercus suber]
MLGSGLSQSTVGETDKITSALEHKLLLAGFLEVGVLKSMVASEVQSFGALILFAESLLKKQALNWCLEKNRSRVGVDGYSKISLFHGNGLQPLEAKLVNFEPQELISKITLQEGKDGSETCALESTVQVGSIANDKYMKSLPLPPRDIVCAFNYSCCCLHKRAGLVLYFKHVLDALSKKGDSNKGNYLIQGDKEKKKNGLVSRFGRFLITFVWVINMLFLIPLPKFFETASKIQDKMQEYIHLEPFQKNSYLLSSSYLVNEVMTKWPSTIEQGDDSGCTPLHIAAHLGNNELVKLLLKNGNSAAYVRNKEGLSALHIAVKETGLRGFMVMFELLKACPDMCELLDNKGRNALNAAVESGGWTAIGFFRKRPEFEDLINEKDEKENMPMHLAAINGDILTASQLAEVRGVVLNATNEEGYTPLDNVLLREKLRPCLDFAKQSFVNS